MTTTTDTRLSPPPTRGSAALVSALTRAFSEDELWLLDAQMEILADNEDGGDEVGAAERLRSSVSEARQRLAFDRAAREIGS